MLQVALAGLVMSGHLELKTAERIFGLLQHTKIPSTVEEVIKQIAEYKVIAEENMYE